VDGCECLGWHSVHPRVSNLAQVLRPSDIDQDLLLQSLPLSLRGPESCGRLIETRNQRNSMRRGLSRSTATQCLLHSCYSQLAELHLDLRIDPRTVLTGINLANGVTCSLWVLTQPTSTVFTQTQLSHLIVRSPANTSCLWQLANQPPSSSLKIV
jgi:hypothetical protein